jgi:hypothetical protein
MDLKWQNIDGSGGSRRMGEFRIGDRRCSLSLPSGVFPELVEEGAL